MAVSPETRAFVLDLFAGLPDVTARPMMGGLAVYSHGQIFCVVGPGEQIFLKAKGDLAADLAAEGSEQFAYEMKPGRISRMGYWSLPEEALDAPELACDWALRSLRATAITTFP